MSATTEATPEQNRDTYMAGWRSGAAGTPDEARMNDPIYADGYREGATMADTHAKRVLSWFSQSAKGYRTY